MIAIQQGSTLTFCQNSYAHFSDPLPEELLSKCLEIIKRVGLLLLATVLYLPALVFSANEVAPATVTLQYTSFVEEFEREILPIYKQHEEGFDSPSRNAGNPYHSRLHISRALLFADVMMEVYRRHGVTNIDEYGARIAVAMHDSGREGNGPDRWEAQSRNKLIQYLQAKGLDTTYATQIGDSILTCNHGSSASVVGILEQSADCLDIMRDRNPDQFNPSYLTFLNHPNDPLAHLTNREEIRVNLLRDVRAFVTFTRDRRVEFNNHPNEGYVELLHQMLRDHHDRWPFLSNHFFHQNS